MLNRTLGQRIIDRANQGYHNRTDYPPYALISADDRRRWSDYIRIIADEIEQEEIRGK